ncbi:M23 family metallopeptidase [Agromyces sp. LHK192]|uniref:M23 family metallopeptidase n=1 Tax=Agromyces sp. LHK192 TaxID=2498704 RepID=UPI00196A33D9|nr:M23 family metallopeptidase [Agromyces sp. LHK192]
MTRGSRPGIAPGGAGERDGEPVVVDFPLRGEGWMAVTTPAHGVPSHGTDMLGQRYAYDFVRVDGRPGVHVSPANGFRAVVVGERARDCYAWGQPVHAPFDAVVVEASDGVAEREWVRPVGEIVRMVRNAATFTPDRLGEILGNHVILRATAASLAPGRGGAVFAALVHLTTGSVAVATGDRVRIGDALGRVGHTGNSTSPHLHFQLMDAVDPMAARGLPCAFRAYEVERDGEWMPVRAGVPGRRERIRSTG